MLMLRSLCVLLLIVGSLRASEPTLGTLDWPPYTGSSLPNEGFITQIVREAWKAGELPPAKIQFRDWTEAVDMGKNGQLAALFPEYDSAERRADFHYSAPLAKSPLGFYAKVGTSFTFTGDVTTLHGKRVGVVTGYINSPAFDADTAITKVTFDSDEANLAGLARGKTDLAVIDLLVAKQLLAQDKALAEAITPVPGLLHEHPLYLLIGKKDPQATQHIDAFNRGLEQLKTSGRLKAILHDHGLSTP